MTPEPPAEAAPPCRRGGLIVPVPEAEAAYRSLPAPCIPVWEDGVPAHVTLLFPFHGADRLGAPGLDELATLFAALAPVRVSFDRVGLFPDILYLCPEPRDWFADLTQALADRFGLSPYAGLHAEIVPHLTVTRHPDPVTLAAVEATLRPALPIVTQVREVWLMEEAHDGRWHRAAVFPLAGEASRLRTTSLPDVASTPG